MEAFGYNANGERVAAFRPLDGYDWQMITDSEERWFTVWRGRVYDSLQHAFLQMGVEKFEIVDEDDFNGN